MLLLLLLRLLFLVVLSPQLLHWSVLMKAPEAGPYDGAVYRLKVEFEVRWAAAIKMPYFASSRGVVGERTAAAVQECVCCR